MTVTVLYPEARQQPDNLETEVLGRAADDFYDRLSTNPAYARITYRVDIRDLRKTLDLLTGSLPNLFTEQDVKVLEAKLQPAAIKEYLTVMRRKLAGPEGMVLKEIVARKSPIRTLPIWKSVWLILGFRLIKFLGQ